MCVCVSTFSKYIFNMCLSIIVTWNVCKWWISAQLQVCMYVKYVNPYKDSFVENYLMKEQLGKLVSDPMIA